MPSRPIKWHDIEVEASDKAYNKVLESFARGEMVAAGEEAINSLYISNAIYLSSWEHRRVKIPKLGTAYEKQFEQEFEMGLSRKLAKEL